MKLVLARQQREHARQLAQLQLDHKVELEQRHLQMVNLEKEKDRLLRKTSKKRCGL
jgi:hypothetical protein